MGSKIKRSLISLSMASGKSQKATLADAISYVLRVKERFERNREKYERFLETVKDYGDRKIDFVELYATLANLFQDHPDLIWGLLRFLPSK